MIIIIIRMLNSVLAPITTSGPKNVPFFFFLRARMLNSLTIFFSFLILAGALLCLFPPSGRYEQYQTRLKVSAWAHHFIYLFSFSCVIYSIYFTLVLTTKSQALLSSLISFLLDLEFVLPSIFLH